MIQTIIEKHIFERKEYWEELIYRLHFLDIKILQYMYFPEPKATYFNELMSNLIKLNVKRTAIRNHVKKLESMGLIQTIKSGILLVNSIPDISQNIIKLVLRCKLRWGE